MTEYAHVTNGIVDQIGLPDVWTHADGSQTSNYQYAPEMFAADGWLPITEIRPDLTAGKQYGPPTYSTDDITVTATYPVEDIPAPLPATITTDDLAALRAPLAGINGSSTMANLRTALIAQRAAIDGILAD